MTVDPGFVADGSVGSIDVQHDNQNAYTLFSANADAVCVAWVTVENTADRGGTRYAVSGDVGRACGATWYASGMAPTQDRDYEPACFWLDADGDQPQTGFQVRWPAFAGAAWDPQDRRGARDPARLCNGVDFGLRYEPDPRTVRYYTKGGGQLGPRLADPGPYVNLTTTTTTTMMRSPRRRPLWMSLELVVRNGPGNSARALCESPMSLGPDFVHIQEGLFCDVAQKKLFPLCGGSGGPQNHTNITGGGGGRPHNHTNTTGGGGGRPQNHTNTTGGSSGMPHNHTNITGGSSGRPQNHAKITNTTTCFDLDSMTLVSPATHRLRGRVLRPRASPYTRLRDWRQNRWSNRLMSWSFGGRGGLGRALNAEKR